jgi:hypothetical protein
VTVPITTRQVSVGSDAQSMVFTTIKVAGGKTVPVRLDTGSTGLVLLSSAIGSAARSTGLTQSLPYAAGTLDGTIKKGTVTIGGQSTPSSTQFVAIAPSEQAAAQRMFGGAQGILGIGMNNGPTVSTVYSPVLQLPSPYWQGMTLTVSASGPGTLVLGPVSAPSSAVAVPMQPATPARFSNGRPAYQKDFIACWSATDSSPTCGDTDMDLGSSFPLFSPSGLPTAPVTDHAVITPGTPISAATPSGTPLWSYTAGSSASTNVTYLLEQGYTEFNTGINFFVDHVVYYDVAHARFLFAPAG